MFNTFFTVKLSIESASSKLISVLKNVVYAATFAKSKTIKAPKNLAATIGSSSQIPASKKKGSSSSILYTFDHGESIFLPVYNTQFHVVVNKRNEALTLTSRPPFLQKGYRPLIPIFLDKHDALDFFYKCFYVVNGNLSQGKYRLGIEKVNIKAYDRWASNNKTKANIFQVEIDPLSFRQLLISVRNAIEPYCPKVEVVLSKSLTKNVRKIRSNKISFQTAGPLEDLFSSNYYKEMLIDSDYSKSHRKEVSKRNSRESDFRSLLQLRSKCRSLLLDLDDVEFGLWEKIKKLSTSLIGEKLETLFYNPEKTLSNNKDGLERFVDIIKKDDFYSFSSFFFLFGTTGLVVKYFYPELSVLLAQLESINARKKAILGQLAICDSKLMSILIARFTDLSKDPVSKIDQEAEQILSKKVEQFNQLHLKDMYGFHIYIDGELSDPIFLKLEDLLGYIKTKYETRFSKHTNLTIKIEKIPAMLIKEHLMNNKIQTTPYA